MVYLPSMLYPTVQAVRRIQKLTFPLTVLRVNSQYHATSCSPVCLFFVYEAVEELNP